MLKYVPDFSFEFVWRPAIGSLYAFLHQIEETFST